MYGQLGLIIFDPVYALGLRDSCEARCVGRLTTCKTNLLEDGVAIMTLLGIGAGLSIHVFACWGTLVLTECSAGALCLICWLCFLRSYQWVNDES